MAVQAPAHDTRPTHPSGPAGPARLGLAAAVGTASMYLVQYRRYRREGGKESLWRWEFAAGVTSLAASGSEAITRAIWGAKAMVTALPATLPTISQRMAAL